MTNKERAGWAGFLLGIAFSLAAIQVPLVAQSPTVVEWCNKIIAREAK